MPEAKYTPLAAGERPPPSPGVPRLTQDQFLKKLDKKIALWTTLNIFIFILTIFVLSSTMYRSHHCSAHSATTAAASANQTSTSGSLLQPQSFFPAFPTSVVVFSNSSYFQDEGARGDKVWADELPEGGGALRVPNPRRFDMPPSALLDRGDSEASEAYAASVTHQLHCLGMVRDVVISSITGRERKPDASVDKHTVHCLDYIRQAILCAGDTTLEAFKAVLNDKGEPISYYIDGIGATHQCRNWNAIKDFLVEHRFTDAEEAAHHHHHHPS